MLAAHQMTSLRTCKVQAFGVRRPKQTFVTYAKSGPAQAATLPVRTLEGADVGTVKLQLKVASPETAKALVHRYLVYVQQNARSGNASTLTKGEVRGGGKKPYAQKGTGNARRGSNTSPLFPGGGITFGPKPKDWSISMNKKERRLALATALQSAAADMIVIDNFSSMTETKTKTLVSALSAAGVDVTSRKCLLVLADMNEKVWLAGRNVEKLSINVVDSMRVFDLLGAHKVVIEKAALEKLTALYGPHSADQQ